MWKSEKPHLTIAPSKVEAFENCSLAEEIEALTF